MTPHMPLDFLVPGSAIRVLAPMCWMALPGRWFSAFVMGLAGAIAAPLTSARFMDELGPYGFFWLVAGGAAGAASVVSLAA